MTVLKLQILSAELTEGVSQVSKKKTALSLGEKLLFISRGEKYDLVSPTLTLNLVIAYCKSIGPALRDPAG